MLHGSLQRLLRLPPDTLILPGHTGKPVAFDGRPLAAPLAAVRASTPLLHADVEDFVASLLARIPPAPPNHHLIVTHNEEGSLPEGDPTLLEAGANRCAIG
jgi:glyoxylase-like metal-dependent hydrolase (beta-lactamase superfamily II)